MFRRFLARLQDGFQKTVENLTDAFQNALDNLQDALRGASGKPVARDDDVTLLENATDFSPFDVIGNDRGSEIEVTQARIVTPGVKGGVYVDDTDNSLSFGGVGYHYNYLDEGESVTFDVEYTIEDGRSRTDTAIATITIEGENDQHRVNLSDRSVCEDAPEMTIDLLGNYEDPEGHAGQAVITSVTSTSDITGLSTSQNGSVFTIDNPEFFDDLDYGESVVLTIDFKVLSHGHETTHSVDLTVHGQVEAPDLSVTNAHITIDEGSLGDIDFGAILLGDDPDGLNDPNGYKLWVVGGADAALFTRSTEGYFGPFFGTAPDPLAIAPRFGFDFEAPSDLDRDNVYELEIALSDRHPDWTERSYSPAVKVTVTVEDTDYAGPPVLEARTLGAFVEEGGEIRYDLNGMLADQEPGTDFAFDVDLTFSQTGPGPVTPWAPITIRPVEFDVEGDELVIDLDQFADMTDFQILSARFDVTVTDPDGGTDDNSLDFYVLGDDEPGVPEPPQIAVEDTSLSFVENTSHLEGFGITVSPGTIDELPSSSFFNTTPRYVITGGEDGHLFRLPEVTTGSAFVIVENGELIFRDAPDFEAPRDFDGDNVYEVEVAAVDAFSQSPSVSLFITVTDVVDETTGI